MEPNLPHVHRFAPTPPTHDGRRPFFSVMCPTYERVELFVTAMRSLLGQALPPDQMQIQVVDNGSTKVDVRKLVRELAGDRVEYFRQEKNVGAFPNFETCVDRARGQWVHIFHDDDVLFPNFYAIVRRGLEANPQAGMAVVGVRFMDGGGRLTGAMPDPCRLPGIVPNWLDQIAVMQRQQMVGTIVRRDAYEAVGGWRLEFGTACDWEMWIRIAARFPVWATPQHLAAFRMHGGSWTSEVIRQAHNIRDTRLVIEGVREYLPPDRREALYQFALKHYAVDGFNFVRQLLAAHDLEGAVNQLREALLCSSSPDVLAAAAPLRGDFARYAEWLRGREAAGGAADVEAARRAMENTSQSLPETLRPHADYLGLEVVQSVLSCVRPE